MRKIMFLMILISGTVYGQEEVVDKKFILVAGTLVAGTIFDVETTFKALENCTTCVEANPLMKPFVERGRPAMYALQLGVDSGVLYWSYRLKKSPNPKKRRLWWAVPVSLIAVHAVAGTLNLRFNF